MSLPAGIASWKAPGALQLRHLLPTPGRENPSVAGCRCLARRCGVRVVRLLTMRSFVIIREGDGQQGAGSEGDRDRVVAGVGGALRGRASTSSS